jgi:hypothetical protein
LLLGSDYERQLSPHIQELELDLREARYLGAILRGGLIEDEGLVDPVENLGQSHVLQEVDHLGFGRLHKQLLTVAEEFEHGELLEYKSGFLED